MNPVLLVFPVPTEEQMDTLSPPLSILYVGAYLENAGFGVSYVDLRVQSMDDLRRELAKRPSLVGISSMTGFQLIGAVDALKAAREISPETPTVLGGVHASILPEQSLADPLVDYVVIGEGEVTLLEMVKELERGGKNMDKVAGLAWKNNRGEVVINESRPFMDLGQSVPPITESSRSLYQHYPIGKVQVARGCPYRCAFCYNTVFNRRRYRDKPLETIEAEIEATLKMAPHVKHFSLLADEIGFKHERIVGVAKVSAKFGYSFHTAIRAEHVDEKLIAAIEGDCEELFLGVEHVAPRIRAMIRKDNTVEDVRKASKAIAASNIRPVWSFMTAFPEETRDETLANMDFADELRAGNPAAVISPFFLTTPFPGTELYEIAGQWGYKAPGSLKEWRDFGLGKVTMPWVDPETEHFSDLYGMSFVLFTQDKAYQRNDAERQWFADLKRTAQKRWADRNLQFKKEWETFLAYNRKTRMKTT